jgi:hypothetical protein
LGQKVTRDRDRFSDSRSGLIIDRARQNALKKSSLLPERVRVYVGVAPTPPDLEGQQPVPPDLPERLSLSILEPSTGTKNAPFEALKPLRGEVFDFRY